MEVKKNKAENETSDRTDEPEAQLHEHDPNSRIISDSGFSL
jgi:hypothetical protein